MSVYYRTYEECVITTHKFKISSRVPTYTQYYGSRVITWLTMTIQQPISHQRYYCQFEVLLTSTNHAEQHHNYNVHTKLMKTMTLIGFWIKRLNVFCASNRYICDPTMSIIITITSETMEALLFCALHFITTALSIVASKQHWIEIPRPKRAI